MMQDGTFPTQGIAGDTAPCCGDVLDPACPTRRLLDRIGDKWSVLVLLLLGGGTQRFNELRRRIGGISQKMLSQTLRTLERDGLVARSVAATMPVSVTYAITPLGDELLGALRSTIDWAEARMGAVAAAQAAFDARTA